MNIQDIRHLILKNHTKMATYRNLSEIEYIVIHHSLTKSGNAEAFANYHVETKGWSRMSYTYVILRDGTIQWASDWSVVTPHVGNSNRKSLGICMVGDFRTQEPTKEQYKSLYQLINYIQGKLNIPTKNVRGHQEMSSYAWKQCPALDMDSLRGNIEAKAYEPVRNNFNNDTKIEFNMPAKVYETIEEKGDDLLVLKETWQWQMLAKALLGLYEKGVLDSKEWSEKAQNKDLNRDELIFVNTILQARGNGVEV